MLIVDISPYGDHTLKNYSERHNTMKDLGKTIAKYRKEHKLNQSELAKRTGKL